MSLLEGFSDYVMDEVGKGLVPGVERISARFHERRTRRTPFERAMLRLTGMDLKMEQYRRASCSSGRSPSRGRPRGVAPSVGRTRNPAATRRDRPSRALDRARAATGRRDGVTPDAGAPVTGARTSARRAGPGSRNGGAPSAIAAQPDPVGPLPLARPRTDSLSGAGSPDRDRVGRGPRRRAGRRRRGDAPRLAQCGCVRPAPVARPAADAGSTPPRRASSGP